MSMDLRTLRQAAARAPDTSEELLRTGRQMLALQAFADAAAVLRRWAAHHPDDVEGLTSLCTALCALGRKEEAIDRIREIPFDLTADIGRLRQLLGLYHAAQETTRWYLTLAEILTRPERGIEEHYALLTHLKLSRDLRKIEPEMDKFKQFWPRDARFWKFLSMAQNEIGKSVGGLFREHALTSGRHALRQNPSDGIFRSYFIQVLVATGRPFQAKWHTYRLAKHARNDPIVWFHVCSWALKLNQRRLFRRAASRIQVLPGFTGIRPYRLGRLLWEAGQHDEARAVFRRLDLAEIQDIDGLQSIFKFARVSGLDDISTAALDQIAELFPDAPILPTLREQLETNATAMTALLPAM